ncbi:MAG: Hsp20/alpha crystallin family protein [Chitinophagaceae bacterium]
MNTNVKFRNENVFPSLFNLMDNFLLEDFTPSHRKTPAVNIEENEDHYLLQVLAPGLSKNDFSIGIEKDILTVSYEKNEEKVEEKKTFIRREFSSNSFSRSFTLGEKIDAENIEANYENGILKITLAKSKKEVPQSKIIEVK